MPWKRSQSMTIYVSTGAQMHFFPFVLDAADPCVTSSYGSLRTSGGGLEGSLIPSSHIGWKIRSAGARDLNGENPVAVMSCYFVTTPAKGF